MRNGSDDESVASLAHACYKLTGLWMEGKGVRAVNPESVLEGFWNFAVLLVIAKLLSFIQSFESKGNMLGYDANFVFRRTSAPLPFSLNSQIIGSLTSRPTN